MDVDHRGLDVCMAHIDPDVGQREDLHGERAERVAEIVEPKPLEASTLECRVKAPPQPRVVKEPASRPWEHQIVGIRQNKQPALRSELLGNLVSHRNTSHLVGFRVAELAPSYPAPDVYETLVEINIRPSQRPQLTHAQTCEGGHDEEGPILRRRCCVRELPYLVGR